MSVEPVDSVESIEPIEPGARRARRRRRRTGRALALALLCAPGAAAPGLAASPCPSGLAPADLLEGDLGPAPAGAFEEIACLEIRNDRPHERRGEIAMSGVPLPRGPGIAATGGLVVVGPGERRLAAQFEVLARWGGPVDDPALPIRWLQVAVAARVGPGGVAKYSLRRYGSPPPLADPFAAGIAADGAQFVVDTGLARVTLDPGNPALFAAIAVDLDDDGSGRTPVYAHAPGAGPRLEYPGGAGAIALDTADPGEVTVDPGGFRVIESGPVRVVVQLDGHFSAADGSSLCQRWGLSYERFGFTLVAAMTRGRRDLDLELHFRNECSDAETGPWTDDAVTVERVSWEWPFDFGGGASAWFSGTGAIASAGPGFSGHVRVEQRRGGGSPWRRRARVLVDGAVAEAGEALSRPFAAVGDGALLATATMPWMRYREPQGLEVAAETLSLLLVSERLTVGEGKGIWGRARLGLLPAPASDVASALAARRDRDLGILERGLLVRTPLAHLNASGLFPGLGTEEPSPIKIEYRKVMDELHGQTVGAAPDGQWYRAKTFGSQLWPDVQADLWSVDLEDPYSNSGAMNYWNPSGAELVEFLRSGEPRWAWDFALPQSWLQAHTAYLNTGARSHGNRAGFAVTSGGVGEGQWHRSAFGSDDYSYDMGLGLAYALRPSPALRDRFRQAGRTAVERYSVPRSRQDQRELWVNQVDFTRQVIQHFEMLANCAEFVPGQDGRDCHDRLLEVAAELGEDNLCAGLFCRGDVPSPTLCSTPQQFMQNALMYLFVHRIFRNYGDPTPGGHLRRGLVEAPWNLYRWGLEKDPDGALVATGDWAAALDCTLGGGGTEVVECAAAPDSDGRLAMYAPTRPHTAALLLMADEIEPALGLCPIVRAVYDDPDLAAGWQDFLGNDSGWWKGAAQMLQAMAFGVGLYDTCGCQGEAELTLAALTVSSAAVYEACDTLTVGPDVVVAAGGDLALGAGSRIVFRDGFRVEDGGGLRARVGSGL